MPNYPIYHCLCKRCGHEWDPVGRSWPRKCPNCKSRKWSVGSWVNPKLDLSIKGKLAPVTTIINIRSVTRDRKWGE